MKKIFILSSLIFFAYAGILIAGGNLEELYKKGNLNYENKDYEKAVSAYEEILKADKASPEVFYNLGNSYFKLKKIGRAILNYERALRIDSRDSDTRSNLKLARSMAVDKINQDERGFVLSAMLFFYDRMSLDELTAICSFLYLAIIILLIFSIFFAARRKAIFYITGLLCVKLLVVFIFLSAKVNDENFKKMGIVVVEKIDARSGPKDDYLLQFTLHEGARVSILKSAQGWYEIGLSKDLKGWVPETSVDII